MEVKECLSSHSLKILNRIRYERIFCDAILNTQDGGEFQIHKCIMASYSSYFEILFTSTVYGEQQNSFIIYDVNQDTLKSILEYIYEGETKLEWNNIREIFLAADQYLIEGLVTDCISFLEHELNIQSCLSIREIAKNCRFKTLEKLVEKYLLKNFVEIVNKNKKLMEIPVEDLSEILKNDRLNVKAEEFVWQTILSWIDIDPSQRKNHIFKLMKCMRLGLLDFDFFIRNVKNNSYVLENLECRPLLTETLRFISNLEIFENVYGELPTPDLARPRFPHEVIFAIGGWSSGSACGCIETYDSRADRWIQMENIYHTEPRAYHKCGVINNNIYMIGGFDGINQFNSCKCFNTITKKWNEIAPMHCKRCYVSVAVLDEIIYAMGGYDGNVRHNTAEKYDHKRNQWTMIKPMNLQRSDASATSMNGYIYIAGGFTGRQVLRSMEYYNPGNDQWTIINPMRSRRSGVSCISYKGCIYVLGGFNGNTRLCTVEKYNPRLDIWSDVPNMLTTRSNFDTVVLDDMIYAVGGFNGSNVVCQVEYYDNETNQWCEATDMNNFRSAVATCVISEIPNIDDYLYKDRDRLFEDRRQRLLELHLQREAV